MELKDLAPLEARLGYTFKDRAILVQSITHRSYLNEHSDFPYPHNERLEFLGDAVLELVVTEYLFTKYGNPEGELTNWRAALVNAKTLAGISRQLNFEEFLLMSKGEARDANSKARMYILANAIEAIIGAIYLDGGWEASKTFIENNVLSHLKFILENELFVDVSKLETAQDSWCHAINKVLEETGPDHAKELLCVFLEKELVAVGKGTSKQEAQVAAAEEGLKIKGWDKKTS